MSKPPSSPPDSDLDGVDEDSTRNIDAAIEAGQDSADLERARRESVGRPSPDDQEGADDRSN